MSKLQELVAKYKDFEDNSMRHDGIDFLMNSSSALSTLYPKTTKHQDYLCNVCIVNCVTAIEIHLKSWIVSREWEQEGYRKLFKDKDKISLADAYEYFNNIRVTPQYLIVNFVSLKNLKSIADVFTCLLNRDFFNEVETQNYAVLQTEHITLQRFPDWRTTLKDVYEIRNGYVHEGILAKLSDDLMYEKYLPVVFEFLYACHSLFLRRE